MSDNILPANTDTCLVEFDKKEYAIVGDLFFAKTLEEVPPWFLELIQNTVVSINGSTYDALAQYNLSLLAALQSIEISKNTYEQYINKLVTDQEAFISVLTTLNASINDNDASIRQLLSTYATEDFAVASAAQLLTASINGGAIGARISSAESAMATQYGAMAQYVRGLEAEYNDSIQDLYGKAAAFEATTAYVGKASDGEGVSSISGRAAKLENYLTDSTTGELYGGVTQNLGSYTEVTAKRLADNTVEQSLIDAYSKYSTITFGGKTYVNGFGLYANYNGTTGGSSTFWVAADQFKIYDPSTLLPSDYTTAVLHTSAEGEVIEVVTGINPSKTVKVPFQVSGGAVYIGWDNINGTNKPADGATRNVNRGTWSSGISYAVGDIVQHNGSSYTNKLATSSVHPTNTSYWTLMASQGPAGPAGATGATGSQGATGSRGAFSLALDVATTSTTYTSSTSITASRLQGQTTWTGIGNGSLDTFSEAAAYWTMNVTGSSVPVQGDSFSVNVYNAYTDTAPRKTIQWVYSGGSWVWNLALLVHGDAIVKGSLELQSLRSSDETTYTYPNGTTYKTQFGINNNSGMYVFGLYVYRSDQTAIFGSSGDKVGVAGSSLFDSGGRFSSGGKVVRVANPTEALSATGYYTNGTLFSSNYVITGYGRPAFFNSSFTTAKYVYLATEEYSLQASHAIYAPKGVLPFTGSHIGLYNNLQELPAVGDLVFDDDIGIRLDISNTLTVVGITYEVNCKSVVGVFHEVSSTPKSLMLEGDPSKNIEAVVDPFYTDYLKGFTFVTFNSVGEGQVNVCGLGGNLEPGDLITSSSIPGKGMKQADDVVRNYTVGKCREYVTFDYPEQVKQVACIYMCG